jgi:replication initiation and membrane attachment protein DnaB
VAVAMPVETDWLKSVLLDRGYLALIKGDAIKVYLVMLDECGGVPDRSVTLSLNQLMAKTKLTCPTVIDSLIRLENLGLVVSTTKQRGKVTTYYVADPPSIPPL